MVLCNYLDPPGFHNQILSTCRSMGLILSNVVPLICYLLVFSSCLIITAKSFG
jgi:hypothetical protein